MKKTISILMMCILFSLAAHSQITKGNWMMGGNVSGSLTTYNSSAGQQNTGYTWQIAPDIGYFFIDKLGVGVKSNITKEGSRSTSTPGYSTYVDFNLGPFVRYYFLPEENIINVVAEGSYLYGFIGGGATGRKGQSTSKNTFSLLAGPVAYFNSSASVEFLIGYLSAKYVNIKGRNNTLYFSLGLQVYIKKDE